MRSVLVLAGLAATLALSLTACSSPSEEAREAAYVASMREANPELDHMPDHALVTIGEATCAMARDGVSLEGMLTEFLSYDGMTTQQASGFVAFALEELCPQYVDQYK